MRKEILQPNKTQEVLIYLYKQKKPVDQTKIFYALRITQSWTSNILIALKELKLIESVKQGRKKSIKLTKKGREISKGLLKYKEVVQ